MRRADGTRARTQKAGPFARPVGAVLILTPHIITIPISMDSTTGLITRRFGIVAALIGVRRDRTEKPAQSVSLLSDGLCSDRASLTN
jgi:hypothetical protein